MRTKIILLGLVDFFGLLAIAATLPVGDRGPWLLVAAAVIGIIILLLLIPDPGRD